MTNSAMGTTRKLRKQGGRASRVVALCASSAMLACLVTGGAWSADASRQGADQRTSDAEQAERERKLSEARKRLDEAAREVAELSRQMAEDILPQVTHIVTRQASRGMLGVNIGAGRASERKDGVEILSVSPGGPAAKAGLKAGDVITEIAGKSLRQDGDQSPRDKLLAVMRDVEPDQKVQVRYLRDGKGASAEVVATRSFPGVPLPMGHLQRLPPLAFARSYGAFGSAELVAMTPKLGRYFGTEEGLLVVRAPADSRLQLEEGDVIVDIDGRVPKNAAHALRILGSYQSGEKLKLTVLRMKKRHTFEITVPEGEGEGFEGAAFRRIFKHVEPGEFDTMPSPPPLPEPLPPPETA
jgi:type II secretory pathway component PulC